jgi:hypothetical protein
VIDFKGRSFGCFGLAKAEMAALKEKAGASSRTSEHGYPQHQL